jgi:protein TonB
MPRSFFDQVLVSTPRRKGRSWITIGSIVLHVLALGVIFVLPLTAAPVLPNVRTALPVMLATATELPSEPEVQRPATDTPQISADAAPTVSPNTVSPEVERPTVSSVPQVPGGLAGVGSSTGYTGLLSAASVGTGLSTPPPPRRQDPVRVGGDVKPPERLSYRPPVYPHIAVAARVEGTVILEATIDAQGVVQNVTVLRSVPMLDRAAELERLARKVRARK